MIRGRQFNIQHFTWYHGGPRADFDTLGAGARLNMPEYLHGHTYATTSRAEAERYAVESYEAHIKKHPEDEGLPEVKPTVYELHPGRSWEPDPHGGSGGWLDGLSREETKEQLREAYDLDAWDGIKVGFPNPVRIRDRHEVDPEDMDPPRSWR